MPRSALRSIAPLVAIFGLSLLSCGREITGPENGVRRTGNRFAMLALAPEFPAALVQTPGASSVVPFEKVRVVLRREDGSIALDTLVDFPVGANEVSLTLQVPIPASAPAGGVSLALNLNYINAAGQTVFSGGPINVTATPTGSGGGGSTPTPVNVPITYTGPGASATAVRIIPKTGLATAGGLFTFTAEAVGANGVVIPNTPIVYSTRDPDRIQIISPATGQVRFLNVRGPARIAASLLTGPTDEAIFDIVLPASRIAIAGGNNQSAQTGATLEQPVSVRVSASDDVAIEDVPVTFTVTSGGGSVTTATVRTNASGIASTSWRLGATPGAQTLSATSTGLTGSPVTFTANAIGPTATKLVFSTQPVNGTAAQTLPTIAVTAQDDAGNTITNFTGQVTIALGNNPGTATLSGTLTAAAAAGIARFTDLKLDRAGTGFTLVATSAPLTSATSSAFNIVPGAASRLVFTQQPSDTTVAGVALAPVVTVAVRDASGNPVTSFTGEVSLRVSGGDATAPLLGTSKVNAVAGIATFPGLRLTRAGSNFTLVAEAAGLGSATSKVLVVRPAPAKSLAMTTGTGQAALPGTTLSPLNFLLRDEFENPIGGQILDFTVVSGGGSLSVASATTSSDALVSPLGTARTVWTLGMTVGAQSMRGQLRADPTVFVIVNAETVTGSATKLVITTEPATLQTAGSNITPAIRVAIRDTDNFTVTQYTGPVTLSIASGPSGAALNGTVQVNALAGVAVFNDVRLSQSGNGYRLVAQAFGLTPDTTIVFDVQPAGGSVLAKATPSNDAQTGLVGSTLALPFRVSIRDPFGNPIAGRTVTWTITSGGGSIASSSITDASGIAIATLTLPSTAGTVSVTATSVGSSGAPVFTATAQAGTATQLVMTTPPAATQTAGSTGGPIVVQVRDAANNISPTYTGTVSLAIASGPSGATIIGPTSVNAVAGVATFGGVSFDKAGTYTVRASTGGLPDVLSPSFVVNGGAATQMVVASGNTQFAIAGTSLPQPLVVRVTDNFGNPRSGVTVNFAVGTGAGTIGAPSATTDAAGLASTTWTLGAAVGVQSVIATSGTLTGSPLTFTATATAGAATQVVITTQPVASWTAGVSGPSIVAQVRDANGNVATTHTGAVQLSLLTSPSGATITGTTSVVPVNGVATFAGLSFTKAGSYTLQVTGTGLNTVTSSGFTVVAGAASAFTRFSGEGQTGTVGQALAQPLQVLVSDLFGNPIVGTTVGFAVTSGGGSVTTSATTNASGVASAIWTLGLTGGTQTVNATLAGVAGSPLTFTATAVAGAATQLVVRTQPPTTITSGVNTASIQVEARDANGLLATGFGGLVTISVETGPTGGAFLGTTSGAAIGGIASISGFSMDKAGTYTIRASATGLSGAVSNSVTVVAGAAVFIAEAGGQNQVGTVGQALAQPLKVRVTDQYGNAVSGFNVAFAVSTNGGTLSTPTPTNAAGETSVIWTFGTTTGSHQVTATATGLTNSPIIFNATANAGAASALAITTQPALAQTAGTAGTAIVVQARDAGGNLASGFNGAVTMSIFSGPSGATIIGTTVQNAVAGVATFSGVSFDKAGSYVLAFTSSGLTGTQSNSFVVNAAAAANLSKSAGDAQSGTVNQPLATPLQVLVTDIQGNPVSGVTVVFTVASGGGSITTAAPTALNGHTTAVWTLGSTVGAQTVQAAATGLSGSPVTFTATAAAGSGASLVFTTQPAATQTAGLSAGGIVVEARDASGNLATSFTGAVTLTTATAPSGTTIFGTATVNAVGGVASFTGISFSKAGAYTITASASGMSSATSNAFTVNPSADVALNVFVQPGGAVSGLDLTAQPVVQILDNFGNLTASTASVSAAIFSGTGTLVGTVTRAAVNGIASFTDLRVNGSGTHSLRFTSSGLASATSTNFTVTQVASSLVLLTQPEGAVTGAPFTTQPVVQILDNAGLVITTGTGATLPVTVAKATGSGTLGGTTTVNAVNGIATFAGLNITGTGAHTLSFSTTTPALVVNSASFEVGALGIRLNVGATATANAVVNTDIVVPILIDLTHRGGDNLASLTVNVTWDPTKFSYISNSAGNWVDDQAAPANVTINTGNTITGVLNLSGFTTGATTTNFTLRTVTLRPIASGSATVGATVIAAGNETAGTVTVLARPLTVTISP